MIGKINIEGAIGFFENEKCVELIDVITQVRKQPNATEFQVTINSDGGICDVGYDIYNFLKSLGLPITTIGQGMVASIATVIFMAGSKRIVKPNTKFMIHLPMIGMDYANSLEVESALKQIKDEESKAVSFYSKELGLNKEAIYPLLRNETYLTEEQLMNLGFVTSSSNFKIAAKITNKPKINKQMSKTSKFKAILNILKGGEVVNKVIFSADNKELVFPDLSEDDPIEVGAKATYDGMPAEGEITTAEGKVYVFEAGLLTEIKDEAIEEEVTDEEMIDALAQTLEVAVELEKRVQTLETETVAIKKERDEFKAKFETATATIAKLKGASPTVQTTVTNRSGQQATTSSLVANWKNNKFKKN